MATQKERIHYLDTLRLIACAFVLIVHASQARPEECFNSNSMVYATFLYFITVASKLFFMITGALLLPVKKTMREFITRRLKVVLIPLVVWTVAYLVYAYFKGNVKGLLFSILFHPADGSLWFVYTMVVMYAFMPILSKFIEAAGKRYIEYYLVFWMLSSLMPYQHGFFMHDPQLSHNMFSSFFNVMGYVVLGYYLHTWPLKLDSAKKIWGLIGCSAMILAGLFCFEFFFQSHFGVNYQQHVDTITTDVSLNDIIFGILYFTFAQRCTPKSIDGDGKKHRIVRLISTISICTYGIYLMHMLFFFTIIFPITRQWFGGMYFLVDILLTALVGFIFCYAISRILYATPWSKWFIGRGQAKKAK